MANSATIDDLPAEVICCEILPKLSLNEIISCKSVSKRFYEIVSYFRAKRLLVNYKEASNSIDCHPDLFLFHLNKPILLHLQHLKIERYPTYFDLNCVNRLTDLKRLNIQNASHLKGRINLKLPNLIDFEFIYNGGCELVVDAVKLARLAYDQDSNAHGPLGSFELVHPQTVTTLETCFYGEQLKPFKNVRHLKSSREFKIFNTTLMGLSSLPELVEINYTVSYSHIFSHFGGWDRILPILKSFMDERRALKRTDLRVFFGGLELAADKAIDDYGFEQYNEDKEAFYLSNYKHLVGIQPVHSVNYHHLMNYLASENSTSLKEIPDDYFIRFKLVDGVEANGRVDQKHFTWFLSCLKSNLRFLNLKNSLLNQSFYSQLPAFSSLRSLKITEKLCPISSWNFISELKRTTFLCLNFELDLRQAKSLLNLIKDRKQFFLNFEFKSRKCCAVIVKDHFSFRLNQRLVKGVGSFEEMIKYFNSMK